MSDAGKSPSFYRQSVLLLKKNYHVMRRNPINAFFPPLFPILMMLVAFILGVDDRFNPNGYNKDTFDTPTSTTHYVSPRIALCGAQLMLFRTKLLPTPPHQIPGWSAGSLKVSKTATAPRKRRRLALTGPLP